MIDFDSYIGKIASEKIEDYKYIYSLTQLEGKRVAFHRADADGIVSAVVVKNSFPDEDINFIPLGYEALELAEFGPYLSKLSWFGIVDLPPFMNTEIELFCDHHQSNVDVEIKARISLFDPQAPSAAILLAKYFKNIDDKTKELVFLTKITDTASYSIPPPLETQPEYETEQEKAWALNDVCKTMKTSEEIIELMERLTKEGFAAIPRYYNLLLANHREKRRISIEMGNKLESSDLVILNFSDDSWNSMAMLHELFNHGTKIGIAFTKSQSYYILNFRHSKNLTEKERQKLRVDKLAEEFGGGGHISASGARVTDYKTALNAILTWAKNKGLEIAVHDIS